MIGLGLLLLAVTPVVPAAQVGVAFTAVGVDDAHRPALSERALTEARALGEVVAVLPCTDEACWMARAAETGAHVILDVRVVRAGPVAQVSTTLWGADGKELAREDHVLDADAFPGGGALLAPTFLEQARVHLPQGVATPPTEGDRPGDATGPSSSGDGRAPGTVEDEPLLPLWTAIGFGGALVAAVGFAAVVAGVAVAGTQEGVLIDATSNGEAKQNALLLIPAGLGGAALGVAVAALGGTAAIVGLWGYTAGMADEGD